MVFCPQCGTENEDEARECKNCGASLRKLPYRRNRRRYEDQICFGRSEGLPIWGIAIGVIIILAGVISLLENIYWWASWDRLWPLPVIALGLMLIINYLYRR